MRNHENTRDGARVAESKVHYTSFVLQGVKPQLLRVDQRE